MKKNLKNIVLTFMFMSTFTAAVAQSETTMTDIYERGNSIIEMLEDGHDMEIVRIEYDIVSSSKSTVRTLYSDWTYTIVGFADRRVADLDVVVYRKQGGRWVEVEHDTDTDNTPVVTITPSSTAEYKIEVSVAQFHEGESAAHYGLMICHDNPGVTASSYSMPSQKYQSSGQKSRPTDKYQPTEKYQSQRGKKQNEQPRRRTQEESNGLFRAI